MIGVRLEPLDTLFLRGGEPFTAESAPQEGVASLFPPHPTTMAGALRAALALCNGWNGQGRWPEKLNEILGDGPENLGKFSLDGPLLLRRGQPLFPAPRHLLGSAETGRWVPCAALQPGPAAACDLGAAVRLPAIHIPEGKSEELKTGDGWWLTQTGMESVLRGEIPHGNEIVSRKELWEEEARIGIKRDRDVRTAREGMLYSTRHIRPMRGVSLGVRIAGIPEQWMEILGRVVPLGGESRLAECREWNADAAFRMPLPAVEAARRAAIIALTPLDLDETVYRGEEALDVPGGAQVVSACLNRPQRIGGWDSLAHSPLPLRCVLPPGSVLFCETAWPRRLVKAAEADNGLLRIGARQRWGFGLAAIGTWSD